LKYVWLPEYRGTDTPKKNTLGWWEKHIVREKKPERVPIGAFNTRSSVEN
jgi:hypothetical protein